MTERREAVARAIDDVINDGLDAWFGGRWESPDWTRVIDRAADAALAAIDAEPTEAGYYAGVVDDVIEALMFSQHIERESLEEVKTFLISACTARQGGAR